MLYTRKGDDGTTKTFACDQRVSKSSSIAEALGSLDEINSFLGLCKVRAAAEKVQLGGTGLAAIVHGVQENLFIIQAEFAGADKRLDPAKVGEIEGLVDAIEKELPPIRSFFISGGTELAALFDVARTIARRAERRAIAAAEEGRVAIDPDTFKYLNRLSSLLYALARYANHRAGIAEQAPTYR